MNKIAILKDFKWNILQIEFLFIAYILWRIIKFNVVFAAELYLLEIVVGNKLIKYPPVESVYLYKRIICIYLYILFRIEW